MTADEIRTTFPAWMPPFCYDVSYAVPTRDWLLNKFYPWFKSERWGGGLSAWTRKNDCDNFARAFCVYCQDAHALTPQGDEGLAVGEFCYQAAAGPHAIVCAFTDAGRIFIEPQTGKEITLTEQEIKSCFRASF
jgi:hypothetical protein